MRIPLPLRPALRALAPLLGAALLTPDARAQVLSHPAISVVPHTGTPDTSRRVQGTGFSSSELVTLYLDGSLVGSVITDPGGTLDVALTPLAPLTAGHHQVEARSRFVTTTQFVVQVYWSADGFDSGRSFHNPSESTLTSQSVPFLGLADAYPGNYLPMATPLVAQGRVFITDGTSLSALDSGTGTVLWSYTPGSPLLYSPCLMARESSQKSKPRAQANGLEPQGALQLAVVIASADGSVHSLNFENGALLWRTSTGPLAFSPIVLKGFNPQPDPPAQLAMVTSDDTLMFLDGLGHRTGEVALPFTPAAPPVVYGGPDSYGGPDTLVALTGSDGGLWLYDVATLRMKTMTPLGSIATALMGTPAGLFAATEDGLLHHLDFNAREIWSLDMGDCVVHLTAAPGLSPTSPQVLAAMHDGSVNLVQTVDGVPFTIVLLSLPAPALAAPVVAADVAYVPTADGRLWALEATTGKPLWLSPRSVFVATGPAVLNGQVWIGNADGALLRFR